MGDIELLIATHPHEDYVGGILDVLNMFEVDNIIDSGYPPTPLLLTLTLRPYKEEQGREPFQVGLIRLD